MNYRRILFAAIFVSVVFASYSNDIWQSDYRDTTDPFFGNVVFGISLPYHDEDYFEGVGNHFTWDEFSHLEGRVFFPRMFGEIVDDLLDQVECKGLFTDPYMYSNGWELWIDEMHEDQIGEQLSYAGLRIIDTAYEDDQLLLWLWDDDEGSDIERIYNKSYPEGVEDPFPDVCLQESGEYHIQVQYYVQLKGNTGDGKWDYSESEGGKWTFNASEGFINVAIAGGEFILIVP